MNFSSRRPKCYTIIEDYDFGIRYYGAKCYSQFISDGRYAHQWLNITVHGYRVSFKDFDEIIPVYYPVYQVHPWACRSIYPGAWVSLQNLLFFINDEALLQSKNINRDLPGSFGTALEYMKNIYETDFAIRFLEHYIRSARLLDSYRWFMTDLLTEVITTTGDIRRTVCDLNVNINNIYIDFHKGETHGLRESTIKSFFAPSVS
jgi:hypothetical protein